MKTVFGLQYFSISKAKEAGMTSWKISTQINNYPAQKIYSGEGLALSEAFYTVHINSFLEHPRVIS